MKRIWLRRSRYRRLPGGLWEGRQVRSRDSGGVHRTPEIGDARDTGRRCHAAASLLVVLAATVALADALPPAWKNWQYSAAIQTTDAPQPRFASVVVPGRVSAHSQPEWADLRVLDGKESEVPYLLRARFERRTRDWRDARLLEVSYKPGESTQGIVDTGTGGLIHNSVVIESSEANYFVYAEVAISDNRRDWRILHDRAPIYRFRRERLEGNQTIFYSSSPSRYLRLRVLDGAKKFALEGVRVAQEIVEEAERAPMEEILRRDPATPARESWWLADFGDNHQPVSEVRFEIAQPEFHRPVRVNVSEDAKSWRSISEGDIYRLKRGEKSSERLRVTFPETRARYWRVEIFNRNDPEIPGIKLALYGTPRRVVFLQEPGQRYLLIYGHKTAKPGTYEMAQLTDAAALDAAAAATLGAEVPNTGWEDPDPLPWSERHRSVLWLALGVAVLVLGALAVRALRTTA